MANWTLTILLLCDMTKVTTTINRMQFLRGDYSGRNSPIRPPWAVDEFLFTSICNACGDCIGQCPTRIIQQGRGHFPVINFESGECLFCGDCLNVCKPHALKKVSGQQPWSITASIDTDKCITFQGVECRSCYDPCEARAISMVPRVSGVSIPALNITQCTGCGACNVICPVQAINMKQHSRESL
jgi:ferredoxin-type protein NapF